MKKSIKLFVPLVLLTLQAVAQDYKSQPGYRFSKEDRHQILMDKSKSLKKKGILALVAGPVITGVGIYIAHKNGPIIGSSGGYLTVRENPNSRIGALIGVAGIVTTVSSIPLFIFSSKAKRGAALLLKDEPTSFLPRNIAVPSLSFRISL